MRAHACWSMCGTACVGTCLRACMETWNRGVFLDFAPTSFINTGSLMELRAHQFWQV